MKRFALSIMVLLAIFVPCFSILAQPAYIPHENPLTVREAPDPVSLLLFYGYVFDLAAIEQYADAQSMLDEIKYANVLDELQYLVERYNSLSRQLFETLDIIDSLLDEAAALLGRYSFMEAKQRLDEARGAIDGAQLLLADIEAATSIISDTLGVFENPAGSDIRSAYERLEDILSRLRELLDRLNRLWQMLIEQQEIQAQQELIATELTLNVAPVSLFVGDSITASGRLTAEDGPLAERKLYLNLDDWSFTTTTDPYGRFSTAITIPYKYVSAMTLTAVYAPAGDDLGKYLACASPAVAVNTRFYSTLLRVSAPATGHPGLPFAVSGQISSTDGIVDRTIKLLVDNNQLAEKIMQDEFSFEINTLQLSTGEHRLRLEVASKGRYAGASQSQTFDISRIPIRADIQAPMLIVFPESPQISGRVYHESSPIQGAKVKVSFRQSSTTLETSAGGTFTAALEAPLDLSLVGPQELKIRVEPVEPWYAPLEIRRWVFTINLANLGIMLITFVSLGLLVYTRVRPKKGRPPEEAVVPEAAVPEPSPVAPPPGRKFEYAGIKGRILSAYLNGLETVEKATGIFMAPHVTLREYLRATRPLLSGAVRYFNELTVVAEIALYSALELDDNTATRVEQLTILLREELSSGSP